MDSSGLRQVSLYMEGGKIQYDGGYSIMDEDLAIDGIYNHNGSGTE